MESSERQQTRYNLFLVATKRDARPTESSPRRVLLWSRI